MLVGAIYVAYYLWRLEQLRKQRPPLPGDKAELARREAAK